MKFYETTADEYISSMESYNLHPEWENILFPNAIQTNGSQSRSGIKAFENMIVYGPSGSGKYTQVLSILKPFSASELKYDKKMTVNSEKQNYTFHISDIHYEIDMSFLGCNSKTLWHDLFCQIVDIISVKPDKIGIIVCKNFHMIHSELLEIFYSYMQKLPAVTVKFVIITEHISFIPNNILRASVVIPIKKPSQEQLIELCKKGGSSRRVFERQVEKEGSAKLNIISSIDTNLLLNLKEIQSFSLIKTAENLPIDIFNIVCDQIIANIENIDNIPFTQFRDSLYDIMIYNLDVVECLWYILEHFIQNGNFTSENTSRVLEKVYPFLQYYNNNYRPIYHLENIMFYMINIIKNEKHDSDRSI